MHSGRRKYIHMRKKDLTWGAKGIHPVATTKASSRSALARLLGGAPAARVRALLSAGSHPGIVFPCLNLQPLTRGVTKGVRRARRLRSHPVISRRTRSSVLSVVV